MSYWEWVEVAATPRVCDLRTVDMVRVEVTHMGDMDDHYCTTWVDLQVGGRRAVLSMAQATVFIAAVRTLVPDLKYKSIHAAEERFGACGNLLGISQRR